MNSMLKIDGRTLRGRQWKDINASGNPLKQGALVAKKICSKCNKAPDMEKEVIECMCCHLYFHMPCLIKPLTENFLETVSTNPSVWWFCLGCITCKSNESTINVDSDLPSEAVLPTDVVMQNSLLSFKRDILNLVAETMENKFNSFAGLISDIDKTKWAETNNADSKNITQKTFAEVTSVSTLQTDSLNAVGGSHTTNVIPQPLNEHKFIVKDNKKKAVLILEPADPDHLVSDTAKKQSLSLINNAIDGVNVDFCKVKKSGCVAIGFESKAALNLAEEKIKHNKDCSSTFSVRLPKKMMPKVTVHGISEILFETCNKEDRDEMKSTLLSDIVRRNSTVKRVLDSDTSEFVSVVMLQKKMTTHDSVTYTAVLKMSCGVRKAIFDNNNRLYISLNRCKVTDRYHVMQCYHCQEPGHSSTDCSAKKSSELPTCFYCSDTHSSAVCPNKNTPLNQKCANCLKSNNPDMIKAAKSHTAASYDCPILQSYMKNIKQKTENWQEKNIQS